MGVPFRSYIRSALCTGCLQIGFFLCSQSVASDQDCIAYVDKEAQDITANITVQSCELEISLVS